MSGAGRPALDLPPARSVAGLRVGVASTRWHAEVTDLLLERALAALAEMGVTDPTVVQVPGALELPLAAQALARDHDAVVVLGMVLRGGTVHFDHVCRAVTDGCLRASLDAATPVASGVLMCDTLDQAWDRSGGPGAAEDKGSEAAVAAVATAVALRGLAGRRHPGPA